MKLNTPILTKKRKMLLLREVEIKDAKRVLQCLKKVAYTSKEILRTSKEFNKITLEQEEAFIQANLDCPSSILCLVEDHEKVIAVMGIHAEKLDRRKHIGELGISVLEEYRGEGIGSISLKEVINFLRTKMCLEKINLSVMNSNDVGIRLYEKLGFEREGYRKKAIKFEDGSYEDLVEMSLWLQ